MFWFLVLGEKMENPNLSGLSDTGAGSGEKALSVPQDFLARVQIAVKRMKAEGITLWRPYIDEELEDIFQVAIVGESEGCTNQQCGHVSHDPASPYIKLVPKSGKLVYLGFIEQGEKTFHYYALLSTKNTRYFQIVSEQFFWDRIYEIESVGVPDFLLARFGGKGE